MRGLALAMLLDQPLRGRNLVRSTVFAPFVISGAAVGLAAQFVFDPHFGLVQDLLHRLGQLNEALAELTHLELAVIVGVDKVAVLWAAATVAPPAQDRADGNIRRLFVADVDPL